MKKKKTERKKIGLWLDHTSAHYIRFKKGKVSVETVHSGKESQVRLPGETGTGTKVGKNRASNQEFKRHEREQNIMTAYYKTLAKRINKADIIYLFGPTTAKDELLNYIRQNDKSHQKTFIVDPAESMTFPQMIARAKAVLETQ